MRDNDQVDGKLVSLDTGNIGDNDMGVKIQFENVWFRYPTRDVPVLNGLDLTVRKLFQFSMILADEASQIEKGQFVAIVGPSGQSSINTHLTGETGN